MARIGIVTLYATGHLKPSLTLARGLQAAGHTPVVFNLPDTAAAATGVLFVPYGQRVPGWFPEAHHAANRMVLFFRAGFRDLPDLVRDQRIRPPTISPGTGWTAGRSSTPPVEPSKIASNTSCAPSSTRRRRSTHKT